MHDIDSFKAIFDFEEKQFGLINAIVSGNIHWGMSAM